MPEPLRTAFERSEQKRLARGNGSLSEWNSGRSSLGGVVSLFAAPVGRETNPLSGGSQSKPPQAHASPTKGLR